MVVMCRSFAIALGLLAVAGNVVAQNPPPREIRTPIIVVPVRPDSLESKILTTYERLESLRELQRNMEAVRDFERLRLPDEPRPIIIQVPILPRAGTSDRVGSVWLPTSSRSELIQQLIDIEIWAINQVVGKLREDFSHLRPMHWDTAQERQRKWDIVQQTERELNRLEAAAREEAKAGTNWSTNDSGSLQLNKGTALRELEQIDISGWRR